MSRSRTAFMLAGLAVSVAAGCARSEAKTQAGREADGAVSAISQSYTAAPVKLVVAPQGNEARYRVREQLLGVDFPNDAVGATTAISGAIALDEKGNVVPGESQIVVNVTGLKSDKERRDGYLQRRTLETEQHPNVVLAPKTLRGVTLPLPKAGTRTIELTGDLTVRGVTRPTTWKGTAKFENGMVTGGVTTVFKFTDFELAKPQVRSVLSVEDDIKLEYDFTLVPEQR